MNEPLGERILVAAVGPVLTALLALLVINLATSWAQQRRDNADSRESVASEMMETHNALYFGLHAFWRAARTIPLAQRSAAPEVKEERSDLNTLYVERRVRGKVIEQRLRIYYRDPSPADNWNRAMNLLSARYFLLFESNPDSREEVRNRHGLSAEELAKPGVLLESARKSRDEALASLWRHKIDRRSKHLQAPHGHIARIKSRLALITSGDLIRRDRS